jgi:hypothetical protein
LVEGYKYSIETGSDLTICIPLFVKIDLCIQKFYKGLYRYANTHTHTQQSDLINLLLLLSLDSFLSSSRILTLLKSVPTPNIPTF